jgi:RNA polymerase sigma-70 factor (ECF subfamily)
MPRAAETNGGAKQQSTLLCLVPAEVAPALLEPLRRHYRDAEVEVEILPERRRGERRSGEERRKRDKGPPKGGEERRLIRNADGRRVGEHRAELVRTEPPNELPRKARPYAERISFYKRIPIPAERAEDLDTARLVTRIQAAAEGQQAFAELYERYFSRVYAYLTVVLAGQDDVEDAAQEVFTQVFEALPSYERRRQPFRAWLFTIARHHALSRLRKGKRMVVSDPHDVERLRDGQGSDEVDLTALNWSTDGDLLLFVERLPLPQRQVLALRYLLDMPLTEIAKIVDRSQEDVRILHHRALRFLEQRLTAVARRPMRGEKARFHRRRRQSGILRLRRFALH